MIKKLYCVSLATFGVLISDASAMEILNYKKTGDILTVIFDDVSRNYKLEKTEIKIAELPNLPGGNTIHFNKIYERSQKENDDALAQEIRYQFCQIDQYGNRNNIKEIVETIPYTKKEIEYTGKYSLFVNNSNYTTENKTVKAMMMLNFICEPSDGQCPIQAIRKFSRPDGSEFQQIKYKVIKNIPGFSFASQEPLQNQVQKGYSLNVAGFNINLVHNQGVKAELNLTQNASRKDVTFQQLIENIKQNESLSVTAEEDTLICVALKYKEQINGLYKAESAKMDSPTLVKKGGKIPTMNIYAMGWKLSKVCCGPIE